MYGFCIKKGFTQSGCAKQSFKVKSYICENFMIDKFRNDKLFLNTDKYTIIIDGVILNKQQLSDKKDWAETIIGLYEENGESFFACLRGCFSGALYDKSKDKWIIFTDQLGQKFLYYYIDDERFMCSSMIDEVYTSLHNENINYHMDERSPYMLLSYGFMLDDHTLCSEIKKICPGCYIVYNSNNIEVKSYYTLTNTPDYSLSEDEIIETLDRLFCQAIHRQYKKDIEYNYKHVCALSAGLDCRMTTFVSHELGYTKQLNLTFSQSNYLDEAIPKQMASDLKHEWIFKSLDNGLWLYDVEKITKVTGGTAFYYGLAHGDSVFRYINFSELGLLHSGQLGDVVVGCKSKQSNEPYRKGDGANSKTYLKYIELSTNYPNKEIGMWYTRYLNGTNTGQQNEYNYTETFSPFLDLDFLTFCLTIPAELRYHHNIYKKWIIRKHPQAAKYIWETIGAKIDAKTILINDIEYPLNVIPHKLKRKIMVKLGLAPKENPESMNPLALYLRQNTDLAKYLDSYFDNIKYISDPKLIEILKEIQNNGSALEKNQAVSLLCAIKMYFNN